MDSMSDCMDFMSDCMDSTPDSMSDRSAFSAFAISPNAALVSLSHTHLA